MMDKKSSIYELSEKQSNIPLWFKGPFYKEEVK